MGFFYEAAKSIRWHQRWTQARGCIYVPLLAGLLSALLPFVFNRPAAAAMLSLCRSIETILAILGFKGIFLYPLFHFLRRWKVHQTGSKSLSIKESTRRYVRHRQHYYYVNIGNVWRKKGREFIFIYLLKWPRAVLPDQSGSIQKGLGWRASAGWDGHKRRWRADRR